MRVRTGVAIALLTIVTVSAGAWYSLWLPGERYTGALPALSHDEREIAAQLRTHIVAIASTPHNTDHPAAYEKAAQYIETTLQDLGYPVARQQFDIPGHRVRNIYVRLLTQNAPAATPPKVLVIGAHYDSAFDAPGANDNGTGTALVLELARLLKDLSRPRYEIHLVLFANEEPPWWGTGHMGSVHYAKAMRAENRSLIGMISLETLGAFSDEPGSQSYPFPLGPGFPGKANFIAFVALPRARTFLHEMIGSFREHTKFPTIGGVGPSFIDGLAWSDHAAFEEEGFPGLMITDTALYRYAHYHKPTDTPDKIDFERLARITKGIELAVRDIAR